MSSNMPRGVQENPFQREPFQGIADNEPVRLQLAGTWGEVYIEGCEGYWATLLENILLSLGLPYVQDVEIYSGCAFFVTTRHAAKKLVEKRYINLIIDHNSQFNRDQCSVSEAISQEDLSKFGVSLWLQQMPASWYDEVYETLRHIFGCGAHIRIIMNPRTKKIMKALVICKTSEQKGKSLGKHHEIKGRCVKVSDVEKRFQPAPLVHELPMGFVGLPDCCYYTAYYVQPDGQQLVKLVSTNGCCPGPFDYPGAMFVGYRADKPGAKEICKQRPFQVRPARLSELTLSDQAYVQYVMDMWKDPAFSEPTMAMMQECEERLKRVGALQADLQNLHPAQPPMVYVE